MLSKKQNLLECIHGGSPDRYVKQFEAFSPMLRADYPALSPVDELGISRDEWGVWWQSAGLPGRIPMHDMSHRVIKELDKWRRFVNPPGGWDRLGIWDGLKRRADAIDQDEVFLTVWVSPGVFERTTNLMEMAEALMALYEEPECLHELIDCITEVELEQAEAICKHIQPEVIFHHDDWGSDLNTFMSVDMFDEFLADSYRKIYGYYKSNGVQVICHHCDSYAATLVDHMVDFGIDVWQGGVVSNDIPSLVKKYQGKLAFMTGVEAQVVDRYDWSKQLVDDAVSAAIAGVGSKTSFIPCITSGAPGSIYPGVYDAIDESIEKASERDFPASELMLSA